MHIQAIIQFLRVAILIAYLLLRLTVVVDNLREWWQRNEKQTRTA